MLSNRLVRVILAVLLGVLILAAGVLLLLLTESALNVWRELDRMGTWAQWSFVGLTLFAGFLVGWILWRLLMPSRPDDEAAPETPELPDEETINRRMDQARESGLDIAGAEEELARLRERREAGEIQVAFFGDISSGKSSLIGALLPDAEVIGGVSGGTTRTLSRHRWTSAAGDCLTLVDMPGLNEAEGSLDQVARDEALRSHVVVFVVDGDMTRSQQSAFDELRDLGKPLVLALSKSDRYTGVDLERLRERLEMRTGEEDISVVSVQVEGLESVTRVLPDGSEEQSQRTRLADVTELASALQQVIDTHADILHNLRDSSVFVLAAEKLDAALAGQRRDRALDVVRSFRRKAVIGALAAVTPGADLVIQGVLASQMIRELSRVYDVSVRKVDMDLLIELVQKHVGKTTTLVLAVAGNALKAFPGLGTITGGAMHAVAYGMVFDTLGRAVAESLAARGELRPVQAASHFEELLLKETPGGGLEESAKNLARLAVEQVRDRG